MCTLQIYFYIQIRAAQWFVMGTKLFFHFLFYAFNIVLGPSTVLFKYDCMI